MRNFLIAVDGSEHSRKTLGFAASLALQSKAHVHLLHVISLGPPPGGYTDISDPDVTAEMERRYNFDKSQSQEIIRDAEARLRAAGIENLSSHIKEGVVVGEIIRFIQSHDIDLLLIGNRGQNDFHGMALGSVAQKVLPLAPCTCIVVKCQ